MKKIDKKKGFKIALALLLIFNAISPLIFVWIVEISMDFKEEIVLTNGFFDRTPDKVYHLALWLMAFTTIITSFLLAYYLDKIVFGKWKQDFI